MTDWNHSTPLAAATAYPQAMIALRVEGTDPTNPALDTFEQVAVATVIAAALNNTAAAHPVSIDLFINLGTYSLPVAVTAFLAGGYSNAGIGGATYVADNLASAALAMSCPRFCASDSTGRHFRLVALGGAIAISQGGALGGTNNDQPAVQAAIDYCKAISCRELIFDFDVVSIWNTIRTSGAGQNTTDAWAQDGQSIWVTAPIKFRGLPTQTRIKMLGLHGGLLETDWQNVGGNVWRGSGINLLGGTSFSEETSYDNTWFAMEDIWLDGGCAYTGVRTEVTPASPDGPDLTNKGIRQQNTEVDNITLINCKLSGFKSETFYVGGGTFVLKNVTMEGSNQSCFNPSTGIIHADNCDFGNTNASYEILGGVGGRLTNCRFYNCLQTSVTGGWSTTLLYNFNYPNRDLTKAPPWLDFVDCEWTNCGQWLGGNYIRIIRGRATDTSFIFSTALTAGSFTSTYIDMDYTIDQGGVNPVVTIQGPVNLTTVIPGAPAGTYAPAPTDIHMRFNIHRTANAIANNRVATAYAVTGEIDPNSCSLTLGKADGVNQIHYPNYAGTTLRVPLMSCEGPTVSQGFGFANGMTVLSFSSASYAIPVDSPRVGLLYTGALAAIPCIMATTYTPAHGQITRVYCASVTTGASLTFAHNGTGLRLNSDCTLATNYDWIEMEFNAITALWHEHGRSIHAA